MQLPLQLQAKTNPIIVSLFSDDCPENGQFGPISHTSVQLISSRPLVPLDVVPCPTSLFCHVVITSERRTELFVARPRERAANKLGPTGGGGLGYPRRIWVGAEPSVLSCPTFVFRPQALLTKGYNRKGKQWPDEES